ncbi:hypothetical protein DFH28DRAFT_1136492 [Melampsora americana]|nr:hypothetical protein DFH28DRAFT_1136492 [Melampsora americana]
MSDWDDLFGENMSVEEDNHGGQSTNKIPLRPSNSAMSLAAVTSKSPHTAPATLFRPPQPQNTPVSATSHPSRSHASLNKLAGLLKLTKENQNVLQKIINISAPNTLPGEEYTSTMSYPVFVCQESKGLSAGLSGLKWDTFKEKRCSPLRVSRLNFLDNHGPVDYVAGEACIPGTVMYLSIKETLKKQCSKLLTKILGVAEDAVVKVPAGKSMVLEVAHTFLTNLRL